MSALAIESQVRVSSAPARLAPTRPATARPASRRPERHPGTMPQFSTAVPLRSGRSHACAAPVPRPIARRTVAANGEWHLTQRGMAVCVSLMSLVAVVSVVTLILQFLAIPAA